MVIIMHARDGTRNGRSRIQAFVAFALVICLTNNWSLLGSLLPPTQEMSLTHLTIPTSTKPILFVHFHKSSGTSVCRALQNVINVTDAKGSLSETDIIHKSRSQQALLSNCNTPFSGPNADVTVFSDLQSCRHLLPYAVDDNLQPRINVVAVEVPFHDAMPCSGLFRSFSIMRHPLTRLQSHMRAHGWDSNYIAGIIREQRPNPDNYYMDGYPIINSMVIRQLLGRERYIDTRPVDEQDLEVAKHIVDQFDAFVPMEYTSHASVQMLLNKTIPEYLEGLRKRTTSSIREKTYNSSEEFLKLITEENKYDIQLYEYVLEKLGIQK